MSSYHSYLYLQELIFGSERPESPGGFLACIVTGVASLVTASIYNLIPDINSPRMTNMPSIEGISATLTGQSPLIHYPTGDAQDVFNQLAENIPRQNIDYDDDYPEGYDPEHEPIIQNCNPLICHPLEEFQHLAMEINKASDPLSGPILNLLQSCSQINMTSPNFLTERYKYLVRVSAKDWEVIRGTIFDACCHGYSAFVSCIEGMVIVYGLQNAKITTTHVKALGDIVDNMKVVHRTEAKQQEKDREFLEQVAVQNNHVLKAMGELMEKFDQKILELSKPTAQPSAITPRAPTTDSQSSKQGKIKTTIKEIPNTRFSTSEASITFDKNLNIMFTPQTQRGKRLAPLFQLNLRNNTLIKILNLDIEQLGSRLSTIPDIVSKFTASDLPERRALINAICQDIAPTQGQWIQSVLNF